MCDNKHMRPFGTSEQIASRRQRALKLLRRGYRLTQVANQVGVTAQSVCRWRRESKHLKRKRKMHREPQDVPVVCPSDNSLVCNLP